MTNAQLARTVGWIYLLQIFIGSFPLYVRSRLVVEADAQATAHNIMASETLFRLGMLSDLLVSFSWFFIAYCLFLILYKNVYSLALLFLIFVIVGITTLSGNLIFLHGSLDLYGQHIGGGITELGANSLAMLTIGLFERGEAAWGFWAGVWLIPLGLAILKTEIVPRMFGYLLIVASLGYILPVLAAIAYPPLTAPFRMIIIYSGLVEVAFGFWLLIKGVDQSRLSEITTHR